MAAIELMVPYVSRPPRAPYLVRARVTVGLYFLSHENVAFHTNTSVPTQ